MTARKRKCVVCAERAAMKGVEPQCEVCAAAWVRMTSLRGLGPAPTISWAARRARAFERRRAKKREQEPKLGLVWMELKEWQARALAAEALVAELRGKDGD